jgi:hypothetical protein
LSTDDALARLSWPSVDEEMETVDLHRSQRPTGDTSSKHHHVEPKSKEQHDSQKPKDEKSTDIYRLQGSTEERPLRHHDPHITSRDELPSERTKEDYHTDLHRTQTVHETRKPKEESLVKQRVQRIESPDLPRSQKPKEEKYAELTPSQRPKAEKPKGISDLEAGAAVAGASLGFAAARKLSQERRPSTPQSQRSASNINRLRTPDINRPESVNSNRSSGTPPLRRSDRKSGDLRSLSQRSKPDLAKEAELAALTSAAAAAVNTVNPTANEGRVRAKDMADVYVSRREPLLLVVR